MKLMKERLKSFNLVLASSSPRRSELMKGLDVDFRISQKYEVDESFPTNMQSRMVAGYLSHKKAEEYPFEIAGNEILVTADTVVILNDEIYGKPKSKKEAKSMLSQLSGKDHHVITGVTLRHGDIYHTFSDVTLVSMNALSKEEIDYYVEKYAPLDKAGAYAIQEWIGHIAIKRIEGSFYNVMGFPVNRFYGELFSFINNTL